MEIPEKYRDIYSKAIEKDSELEKGKGVLKPKNIVVRQVENIIRLENDIEASKKILKGYGISTDSI